VNPIPPMVPPLFALALAPILLDAALKSLLVLAVAGVAVVGMRRCSAAARHLVWFLAVTSLLALPLFSWALPGWHVLPRWMNLRQSEAVAAAGGQRLAAAAPNLPPAAIHEALPAGEQPEVTSALGEPASARSTAEASSDERIANPRHSRLPIGATAQPTANSATQARLKRWQLGLAVWLAGAAFALVPTLLGLVSLWRLERGSRRETDLSWLELLRRLVAALSFRRSIALLKSRHRRMPMTWGVLHPKLLLPEESQEWPEERRRVVMLHELAHAKRWDYLTNLVTQLACALYWFNPLVWLAARQMVAERERACDDIVLRHGAKPAEYAEQVLQIAAGLPVGRFAGLGAIPMARPSKLEGRLLAILDGKRNRAALTRVAVVSALVLLAAVVVPVAMMKAAPAESPQSAIRNPQSSASLVTSAATGWGEPVEGLQVRLHSATVAEGEVTLPRLLVDIANLSKRQLDCTTNGGAYSWQLEVDGQWYVRAASLTSDPFIQRNTVVGSVGVMLEVKPGQPWTNLPLVLNAIWRTAHSNELTYSFHPDIGIVYSGDFRPERLNVAAGKHMVRLAVVATPKFIGMGEPVRALSQPVEIEVAAMSDSGSSRREEAPSPSARSEARSANSSQSLVTSAATTASLPAGSTARIPKSAETVVAELRNILPEDWTCQLILKPGAMEGSYGQVKEPLFRIDFTNFNISFANYRGGGTGGRPEPPHPCVRLYFLPAAEKARFQRSDRDTNIWDQIVILLAETPDYSVVTSLDHINSGKGGNLLDRSIAPLGRALEKYFGKLADEKTGDVLGMGTKASDGLTTGIGVTGQVVDDQTGKPIKEFSLEWSVADSKQPGGDVVLRSNFTIVFFGGRFGAQFQKLDSGWSQVQFYQGGQQQLNHQTGWVEGQKVWPRVRADGYLPEPVTPGPVVWPVKLTNLVVRLKRANAPEQPAVRPSGQRRNEVPLEVVKSEVGSLKSDQSLVTSAATTASLPAGSAARIPKSAETVVAELRNILPEDWTCQLILKPGEMEGSYGQVKEPLFRIDFTNFNISFANYRGGVTGSRPEPPHPCVRLYFLPVEEKARFQRGDRDLWNQIVILLAETPDYSVVTSLDDINSGKGGTLLDRSIAPLGRALEKYFGKLADEKTGDVLGMGADASNGLTTGIGVSGQVLDDQTGKPIKEFSLEWSVADSKQPGGDVVLRSNFTIVFFGGRFGAQFQKLDSGWSQVLFWKGGQQQLNHQTGWVEGQKVWPRVRADGYLPEPVTPGPVVWPVKLTNLVVRLKRANTPEQPAVQPSGQRRNEVPLEVVKSEVGSLKSDQSLVTAVATDWGKPDEGVSESKWDRGLPQLELRKVNLRAEELWNGQIRITQGDSLTEAWRQVSTRLGIRAVMFVSEEQPLPGQPNFEFVREKCTVEDLLKAFVAAYPGYTYTQDEKTGVIWIHPQTIPYDRILPGRIKVVSNVTGVPMLTGVLDKLAGFPSLLVKVTNMRRNLSIMNTYQYPVDLPAGTYSVRDVLNLCCLADPDRTFAITAPRDGGCEIMPSLVFSWGIAVTVHATGGMPGALDFWRREVNALAQGPPSQEQLIESFASTNARVRWAARMYAVWEPIDTRALEAPAAPTVEGIWAAVGLLGARELTEEVRRVRPALWLETALRDDTVLTNWPALRALAAVECARVTQDATLLERAAKQPLSESEIAQVKPDMIRNLRYSAFVRQKLVELNPQWAGFSKAEIEELGRTNIFQLP
jgi:beta-lactamase regulating signal transducer with metallopeptidase domain